MSDLSRSLVDAAAAEAWNVQSASELTWRSQQRVQRTVAAVLETLAEYYEGPGSIMGAGSFRQLATEVREDTHG